MRGWSEIEEDYLEFLMKSEPNQTYEHYARKMEIRFSVRYTSESVRNKLRRKKVNYVNQKNADVKNVGELLDTLIQSQKKLQEYDDRQTEVTIEIKDEKPIGLIFSGDWHIGGLYTDHEMMKSDFELFGETDGLYVIAMGDYCDNYITRSHAGGMFDQVISPDNQRDICEHMIDDYLQERLLVMLKGNHDNWELKETGEDFVKYLARKAGVPYLWYGGEITLKHWASEYKIHAHHSYRYNSSINTSNSQRNLFNSTHADIIALGHFHFNEVHMKSSAKKDTVWIRSGSYKITDDYSQWLGGLRSDSRSPMVILWGDEKKMLPFRDYKDGINYLKMVRA